MKSFTFQCKTPFFRVMSFLTLSLPLVLLMGLFSGQALAVCEGPMGTIASLFEDEDGDLDKQGLCSDGETVSDLDWNTFASSDPVSWTGASPNRVGEATETESGWTFVGVEDAKVSSSDVGFVGGTKQDDECAAVTTAKALNKGDLERIYLSTNTVGTDIFLNLGWVRIPQNSTSASAHVAFEFNKADPETKACPEGSDGLVQRTDGDMLIVYDFEGGSADPIIKLARWTTDPQDACDVESHDPALGCWGVATELTSIGAAEAAVNVGMSVYDAIGPDGSDTLGVVEFGEAGINLTEAGVFADGQCESFGSAFAVSRSSGNSGTAQMKDLVGPTPFELDNCGKIKIVKQTSGGDGTFGFSFLGLDLTDVTTTGGSNVTSNSFDLATTSNTGTFTINEVPVGIYTVEEVGAASGFSFKDLICKDDSDGGSNNLNDSSPLTLSTAKPPIATIKVDLKEEVTCTFRNEQASLTVNKAVVNACTENNDDGGVFDLLISNVKKADDVGNGGSTGTVILAVGGHTVSETMGNGDNVTEYFKEIGVGIGDDCNSSGAVTLEGGDNATCTIRNTRLPHIKVTKHVVDGLEGDLFDLYIDGNKVFDNAGDTNSIEVAVSLTGPHTVSEKASDGSDVDPNTWLTNIKCSDGSSAQGTSLGSLSLDSGELLECEIYNIKVEQSALCVQPNND